MARIGLTGLGTMGAALALNMADRGHEVAVHNRTTARIGEFIGGAGDLAGRFTPAETFAALAAELDRPRAVVLMVPAGTAVDDTLEALLPHLDDGDIVIDGGNADFNDTVRRGAELSARGIRLLGMGVSGGEEGARHGPSIMVGGPEDAWDEVKDVITSIAATYRGDVCAAHLGPDGAGHFVKTVHNGIEYADMQLIAEAYGMLRRGQGQSPEAIADLFETWNGGPLRSYLTEITATALRAEDPHGDGPMVDAILDMAGQKGTGRWTVIEAQKLGQAATVIEAAVAARSWSSFKEVREAGEARFGGMGKVHPVLDADMEAALIAARILAHAQGFEILRAASAERGWALDLARVAEIWRAGCIIRSAMLDDIATSVRDGLPDGGLVLAPHFANLLEHTVPGLRRVVGAGLAAGLPMPAMTSALAYFDSLRTARGTTDLIQAQRDIFGRHGFRRVDGRDDPHGPW